jgi:predicted ATPase
MRVTGLSIRGLRSIEQVGPLELGPVTVLVGPNNTGKSSLLRALMLMQSGFDDRAPLVRIGQPYADVNLELTQYDPALWARTSIRTTCSCVSRHRTAAYS